MTDSPRPDLTIGERLRLMRKERGLSTAELGRRAGAAMGRKAPISSSAVRNQENGTNGLPIDVAVAYAEILSTTPNWLLFGRNSFDEAPPEPKIELNDGSFAPLTLEDIAIPVDYMISGHWHPLEYPTDVADKQPFYMRIPGYEGVLFTIHAVIDESLSPKFPANSLIVACDPQWHGLHHNDFCILNMYDGADGLVACVRQLKRSGNSIDFVPLNNSLDPSDGEAPEPLRVVRNGEHVLPIWVEAVVLYCLFEVPPPRGALISQPRTLFGPEVAEDGPRES